MSPFNAVYACYLLKSNRKVLDREVHLLRFIYVSTDQIGKRFLSYSLSHPSYRRLATAFRGVIWYCNFNDHESQYYIIILFHVFGAVRLNFSWNISVFLLEPWWVTTRHLTVCRHGTMRYKCDLRVYAFLLWGDCEHENISQCKAMQQRYNCLKRFLRHTVQHSCNVRISVDFLLDNGQKHPWVQQ